MQLIVPNVRHVVETSILSQPHEETRTDSEKEDEGDAVTEEANDDRFSFVRNALVDQPTLDNRISE